MTRGLAMLPDDDPLDQAVFGVVIGLVSQIAGDPDELNRVLVTFPTLGVDSAWARVASFFAGPQKGAMFFPAVGDEVLVLFEGGDIGRPYVIGALWNGVDLPAVPTEQLPVVRELRTASGARLQFDDTEGAAKITVTDQAGNAIVIDSANNKISVTAVGDLSLSAPGRLSISGGEVTIKATGSLALSANGEGSLAANGPLRISGTTIDLN